MAKLYHISDGKLLLSLQPESAGWFTVTSPTDPAMITQARSIPEAFEAAQDAFAMLTASRADAGRWSKPIRRKAKAAPRQRPLGAAI